MEFYRFKYKYKKSFWVVNHKSLEASFLKFGDERFMVGREKKLPPKDRLANIFAELAKLKSPSLLVVDNVNDSGELKKCLYWLKRCYNLHILITTRIPKFSDAEHLWLEEPKLRQSLRFFKMCNTGGKAKRKVLKELLGNVNKNPLMVRILAQAFGGKRVNVPYFSLQTMADELHDILLDLGRDRKILTRYNAGSEKLQLEHPEDLVMSVYQWLDLPEEEKSLLSALCVLPSENIAWEFLKKSYPDLDVFKILQSLAAKGFLQLETKRKLLSVCPLVENTIRFLQKDRFFEDSKPMIEQVMNQLSDQSLLDAKMARYRELLLRYTYFIIGELNSKGKELAVLNGALGNYHKNTGNLRASLPAYGKSCLIFEDLYKDDAENPDLRYNLAVSYYKLGSTHRKLQSDRKALKCFERNTKLTKELHDDYPKNSSLKDGLASSLERLAEVHRDLKNVDKALACYKNCVKLTKVLCQSSPDEVSHKKRLVKSYENLGDIHKARRKFANALDCFENGVRQAMKIYQDFSKDVEVKKNLVQLYSKLGSTQLAMGRVNLAHKCFGRENSFLREMVRSFPKELQWKKLLAHSWEKLGSMHSKLGQSEKALKCFQQEIALFGKLCKSFPKDTSLENGLAVAYAKLATFYRDKQRNLPQARNYFGKAKSLWGNLAGQFPQNKMFATFLGRVKKDLQKVA